MRYVRKPAFTRCKSRSISYTCKNKLRFSICVDHRSCFQVNTFSRNKFLKLYIKAHGTYTCMYIYTYAHMYIYIYTYIHVFMLIFIFIFVYRCIYIHICIDVYVSMSICMYKHANTHIYC